MQDAAPVVHILLAERDIQSVSMTRGNHVGRRCTFTQHLLDRIAGDEVDQQKDDRHHQPDYRQHVQQAG